MKKKTAKVSELVDALEKIKEVAGDVNVYVVHMNSDQPVEGMGVEFNGLSDKLAVMKVVDGDETGVMVFQSDEILRP